MDIHHPYASDASRIGLLYRLSMREEPAAHALVVTGDGKRAALDLQMPVAWIDPAALADRAQRGEAPHAYPLVVFAVNPVRRGPGSLSALLAHGLRVLAPGGSLGGCVPHRWSLRRMASSVDPGARRQRASCAWSVASLSGELRRAGLEDAQTFFVRPSIESPMALIGTQSRTARRYFRWEIRLSRHNHVGPGYLARLLIAEFGLSGLLQDSLLFWGRAPRC
ncbi:MAG: hypothetical protein AMXMBFR78_02960 [Rubrivivax sp.]|jgi:hypothetical protein